MPRIPPVRPPYEPGAAGRLDRMMPPGVPPILLFRTFVRNLPMTDAMSGWGSYELGRDLSLSMRDREIVIDRTCARCGCEYEWGVHVMFFAGRAGLTAEQVTSLTHGGSGDACWSDERDRLLIDVADALHDRSDVDDGLWSRVSSVLDDAEVLDLFMLCGWYHAISFTANGSRVELEDCAPRFADTVGAASAPVR